MASEEKHIPMETGDQQAPVETGEHPHCPYPVEIGEQQPHVESGEQQATMSAAAEQAAVKTGEQEGPAAAESVQRNLFVLIDDSQASHLMWKWAQEHEIHAGDHVTLVTVARVFTYWASLAQGEPVMSGPVMSTTSGGTARIGEYDFNEEFAAAKRGAHSMLQRLKEEAAPKDWTMDLEVVTATEDASVGELLVHFLKTHHEADEAIIGSRQMGSFKKAMLTIIGKGSVSDYVVKHAPCHVVVYPPAQ